MLKAILNYKSYVPQTEKSIGEFVNVAVEKSLAIMERNIKVNTPVLHGYLRRSITSKMTGFGKGEVFTNPIGSVTKGTAKKKGISQHNEVSYGVFVEYGTKHMAPRAMFRKGVAQSENQIKDTFKTEAWRVKNGFTL